MKIYAKVTKSFDEGKVKAICDVILNGTFAIHGVRLIEGEKGRFVAMPCQKFGKTPDEVQYRDIVHPLNAEARADLFAAVEKAYEDHVQGICQDDLPFGMN
jgi:stage V sporulation protein G